MQVIKIERKWKRSVSEAHPSTYHRSTYHFVITSKCFKCYKAADFKRLTTRDIETAFPGGLGHRNNVYIASITSVA